MTRIVRDFEKRADPRNFGVTFDGSTDDSAAWLLWLAWITDHAPTSNLDPDGGVGVVLPKGQTLSGATMVLPQRIKITGQGHATQLVSTTADRAFFDIAGRHMQLSNLHFVSALGSNARCLDLSTVALSALRDITCTQPHPDRPAIYHDPAGNGIYSSLIDGLTIFHDDPNRPGYGGAAAGNGISVPSFDFDDTGANLNANLFSNWSLWGGLPGSTAPVMRVESDTARTHNNQLNNVHGEFCTAGMIHLNGGSGWQINNPSLHDTAGYTINDHVIKLGASGDDAWGSRGNVITAYDRRDGTLNTGIADIWCDDKCTGTVIVGLPERPNQGYTLDFNGSDATVVGLPEDLNNDDIVFVNADQVAIVGRGTLHRFDTGGTMRSLAQPTGAGPATWA